jgi:transcriptional regulator with XRE-family HTH domain
MSIPDRPSGPQNDELSKLGARLKDVREYLNFSQQYVSERTGIPRSAISDLERGVRRVDGLELKKLARLYRYPVGFFLDEQVDAVPGDHAVAALARALTGLTEVDREQVLRFAEFLRFANGASQDSTAGEAVAGSIPPPEGAR